nr:hypothetical protein [Tanacetum cinerariifolium]
GEHRSKTGLDRLTGPDRDRDRFGPKRRTEDRTEKVRSGPGWSSPVKSRFDKNRHKSSPIHPPNLSITSPHPKMLMLGNMSMVMRRSNYPSLLMWLMFLLLISACVSKTKGSSSKVPNTQFFETMRPRISHKYANDGAAFKGLLPKALPIPPSGPSHHHNSIGINSMQP